MAITDTPTSAKTASHIFATPKALIISTTALIPSAKTMFCLTIQSVFLEMAISVAIFMRINKATFVHMIRIPQKFPLSTGILILLYYYRIIVFITRQ